MTTRHVIIDAVLRTSAPAITTERKRNYRTITME